jgi:TolB-like protein
LSRPLKIDPFFTSKTPYQRQPPGLAIPRFFFQQVITATVLSNPKLYFLTLPLPRRLAMRPFSRSLLVLCFVAIPLFSQEKQSIAIARLTSSGISQDEALSLTDALRSELGKTGKYQVVERSQMDEILKEQGFQQSGACNNEECALEIGKLLSVQNMVLGSIGKVGETFAINIRLVDIKTGKIENELTENYKGKVDGLLTDIIPRAAQKLAGTYTPPVKKKKTGLIIALTTIGVGAAAGAGVAAWYFTKSDPAPAPDEPTTDVRIIWNQ